MAIPNPKLPDEYKKEAIRKLLKEFDGAELTALQKNLITAQKAIDADRTKKASNIRQQIIKDFQEEVANPLQEIERRDEIREKGKKAMVKLADGSAREVTAQEDDELVEDLDLRRRELIQDFIYTNTHDWNNEIRKSLKVYLESGKSDDDKARFLEGLDPGRQIIEGKLQPAPFEECWDFGPPLRMTVEHLQRSLDIIRDHKPEQDAPGTKLRKPFSKTPSKSHKTSTV